MIKFCILGNDKRSLMLRKMYESEDADLTDYKNADIIIAPIPFSKDGIKVSDEALECQKLIDCMRGTNKILFSGAISKIMKERLKENNITYFDLMEFENVAILNSIPTAEGAISIAMEHTDFTLHSANTLVLGYGKIGKTLCKMLNGIGSNIYAEARNENDLAQIKMNGYHDVNLDKLDKYLPKMDIIFNTIPVQILDEKRLSKLNPNCLIVDLASSPGGVDFAKAKELKINVIWALSLPSKVAPQSAAKYLKDAIDKILEK